MKKEKKMGSPLGMRLVVGISVETGAVRLFRSMSQVGESLGCSSNWVQKHMKDGEAVFRGWRLVRVKGYGIDFRDVRDERVVTSGFMTARLAYGGGELPGVSKSALGRYERAHDDSDELL